MRLAPRHSTWLVLGCVLLLALVAGGCRAKKYENPITKDTQQPDKVLYDKAIKDIEKGRYEVARLTLNTLMNTYDTSEYLAKAKLAIADSWMREGGSHALAQAEAEYKDFILFYPTMEESSEAQMKICEIHFEEMEKADRDATQALRADEECRQLLTQFPNSRHAPTAAQRMRQIQEVLSESEFRVGSYYYAKGSYPPAANRLQTLTDQYPLFSSSDQALMMLGDSYSHMGPRFKQKSITAFQKLVREYPLSPLVPEAKRRLTAVEAEIPEADPVAYARMKYEIDHATPKGLVGKAWTPFAKSPDVSKAAKSGQPAMTTLRPSLPANVPAAAAAAGVTDVTVSTQTPGATSALDTQPDARLNQPAADPKATTAAPATAQTDAAQPAASGSQPATSAAQPAADSTQPAQGSSQTQPSKKDKKKKKSS